MYCNEVGWKGLVSVTIHLLYLGSGVQFGHAVGQGHWVSIQLLYCDMVFFLGGIVLQARGWLLEDCIAIQSLVLQPAGLAKGVCCDT